MQDKNDIYIYIYIYFFFFFFFFLRLQLYTVYCGCSYTLCNVEDKGCHFVNLCWKKKKKKKKKKWFEGVGEVVRDNLDWNLCFFMKQCHVETFTFPGIMDTTCVWLFCTIPAWDNTGEIRISIPCEKYGSPYLVYEKIKFHIPPMTSSGTEICCMYTLGDHNAHKKRVGSSYWIKLRQPETNKTVEDR